MSKLKIFLLAFLAPLIASSETYEGYDLPGYGRDLDFIGKHKALPQLAKILAQHYGFRCSVFEEEDPSRSLGPAHLVVVGPAAETEPQSGRPILKLDASTDFSNEDQRRRLVVQIHEVLGLDPPSDFANVALVETFDPNPEDPYAENPPDYPYLDVTSGREGYEFAGEPVNRFRLYEFYRRQALYHLDGNEGPAILPEFPALDGGAFGHWGRFHKNAFRDQRWNWMNNGQVVAAIFRADGAKPKPRSIMFQLGESACAYDTETLRFSHFWTDGFVRFISNRWGIGGGAELEGKVHFATDDSDGWRGERRFLGYYQHGERGVLKIKVEDAEMLELPGAFPSEAGPIFTRTIEFLGASLEQQLLLGDFKATSSIMQGSGDFRVALIDGKNRISTVCAIDKSKMKGVAEIQIRPNEPASAFFYKTLKGATATIFFWRGESSKSSDAIAAMQKHSETQPSTLINGGPARWDWKFEAAGQPGKPRHGLAVDRIPVPLQNPNGSLMLLGGHDFLSNGDAAVCTMMGDVWIVSGLDEQLKEVSWKRFATGLNQALGVEVIDDKIHAIGRDRITRLHDLNADGEADFYENLADSIPASVGGHDFTVGLQADDAGNFYTVAAGEVIRVNQDGSSEVIASGLRNANGVGASSNGIVTTSTNEGDWTPATAVFEVREGDFYGRSAKPGQEISPPLCYIPRGVDNSAGGQVFIEHDAWKPLQGALVHTSFGNGTMSLILRDETADRTQGAVIPIRADFNSGAHRARFSPKDGQLYLTGSDGWGNYAMDDGSFDRVRYVGGKLNLPAAWKAHANGILVRMTDPIDPSSCSPESTFVQQWNYEYSPGYGSREYSLKSPFTPGHDRVKVASVQVFDDHTLFFEMPAIEPVMQMHLVSRLKDASGEPFVLEMFPTLLSLAESRKFNGMRPVAVDKNTKLALRVRHAKGKHGPKIPTGGAEGRIVQIDMIAGLRFSVNEVRAKPKERLTFVLTNKDPMPHNFVLIKPGSLDKVGAASNELLTDPDAFSKHYVPEMDEVIWHSHLMEHSAWTRVKFNFDAPEKAGAYPFICTFPGHWMIMKGELIVE
ncbi:MAG: azurin [Verrucomicrobiales bacterium]|jgi:azurin